MSEADQSYLTSQIESVIRSTVAARSLKSHQARILSYRIAKLVGDEMAMIRERQIEA